MSQPRQPAPDDSPGRDSRSWLSAAVDGDEQALDRACAAWRSDAQTRATWHTYHLIGDAMRSSELANRPAHDEAFLATLRTRLAAEPVVLAPQPLPAAARRTPGAWRVPAAVAAGFAVVAGVLVVSRLSTPTESGAPALASASSAPGAGAVRAAGGLPVAGETAVNSNGYIRDARLDEYLRAHQAARGAIGVPGGGLRRADVELPSAPAR